ncbi:MAG: class I SAM-dependent methyltransferase [Bauldia sp.]|nr:class I SAM-dependent methyltransferase [Bauldia sp.]MCW5719024.1 class I SAM-dependent methyltransferase [Bauldia sp.]
MAPPLVTRARNGVLRLLRRLPRRGLRSVVAERERVIKEREATVREREATILEREAIINEQAEAIRQLRETVAVRSSEQAGASGIEAPPAEPSPRPDEHEDGEPRHERPDSLTDRIVAALPRIEGWCTERKALWLADLITANRCTQILEIGVYGGRSLIPMAMAVQSLGAGGKVYGVEAWSNSVAVATETSPENDAWWQSVDLKAIKTGFLRSVVRNQVADVVVVLEMSSDQAFATISATGLGPFDLVHVDGSHSEVQALRDVEQWSDLVRPGGILVLDDIGWPSVKAAREHVRRAFSDIEEIAESAETAYGAYRRGPDPGVAHSRP